jgi:hypothetical protein
MKGKPTWKPHGLRAKRWREAAYTRGPAVLHLTKQGNAQGLSRTAKTARPESNALRLPLKPGPFHERKSRRP